MRGGECNLQHGATCVVCASVSSKAVSPLPCSLRPCAFVTFASARTKRWPTHLRCPPRCPARRAVRIAGVCSSACVQALPLVGVEDFVADGNQTTAMNVSLSSTDPTDGVHGETGSFNVITNDSGITGTFTLSPSTPSVGEGSSNNSSSDNKNRPPRERSREYGAAEASTD